VVQSEETEQPVQDANPVPETSIDTTVTSPEPLMLEYEEGDLLYDPNSFNTTTPQDLEKNL